MSALSDSLASLSSEHRDALLWFWKRRDDVIEWPETLDGLFLVQRAKGIHKPKGWAYALSVRQTLNSPYADKSPLRSTDGSWTYEYFQEGHLVADRDKHAANRSLIACEKDGVPVAVLFQERAKPTAKYRVLGLAKVMGWEGGYFALQGYRPDGALPGSNIDYPEALQAAVAAVEEATVGAPLPLEDARRRIDAQIVARQGGRAFREKALQGYSGRCAISKWSVGAVLEAAHIVPHLGRHTDQADNCILLRSDLHVLFDRHLLQVDPDTLRIRVDKSLTNTPYDDYAGQQIVPPEGVHPDTMKMRLRERARFYDES